MIRQLHGPVTAWLTVIKPVCVCVCARLLSGWDRLSVTPYSVTNLTVPLLLGLLCSFLLHRPSSDADLFLQTSAFGLLHVDSVLWRVPLSRSAVFKLWAAQAPPPFAPSLLLLLLICLWISICHFVSLQPPWSLISPSSRPRLTLILSACLSIPGSLSPASPVFSSLLCSLQLCFALFLGPLGPSAYCLIFKSCLI